MFSKSAVGVNHQFAPGESCVGFETAKHEPTARVDDYFGLFGDEIFQNGVNYQLLDFFSNGRVVYVFAVLDGNQNRCHRLRCRRLLLAICRRVRA